MLKSRTMWVYSALRPWDSTMHLRCRHNVQKIPSSTYTSRKENQRACSVLEAVGGRAFASAPACRDSPRPVCGREGSRRTRMEPGAAGAGNAAGAAITPRPAGSCSGVAPEEPPPRLVPAPGGWAPAWTEREVEPETGALKKPEHPLGLRLCPGAVGWRPSSLLPAPPASLARPGSLLNAPSFIIHQQALPRTSPCRLHARS